MKWDSCHTLACYPLLLEPSTLAIRKIVVTFLGVAMLLGTFLAPLTAQETQSPWICALPGLDHPAAWSLEDTPVSIGMQRAPRWNEDLRTLESVWLGVGWQPFATPSRAGARNKGGQTAIGLVLKQDPLASGWSQSSMDLSASTTTRLSRLWIGAAGLAIGASHWRLDPSNWSWNAQYGAQGYDPSSPTGEVSTGESAGGWKWNSALSLALRSTPTQRTGALPELQAAATLRHIVPGNSPQLSPVHADTVKWLGHWWIQAHGDWKQKKVSWRAWHRGGWQGHSALAEWGGTLGRTLGQSSRFTNSRTAHVLECGMLIRTEGTLRAVLGWSRGGMHCWVGPGWTVGTLWRPPPGWSIAFSWRPEYNKGLSLQR